MKNHRTLLFTHRGERHQQVAIGAAPQVLDMTIRSSPTKDEIIALVPKMDFLITERTGSIDAHTFFAETKKMVNDSFLARMKPGACRVCCGGSGILDEAAITRAVSSERLYGAATDTYAWEPVRPDNPLLSLARGGRQCTPHAAHGGGHDGGHPQRTDRRLHQPA